MDEIEEEPQTAILLTEREWRDLAHICAFYSEMPADGSGPDEARRCDLARRIIEAAK